MDEWVTKPNREPTVEKLMSALTVPGFMDVKFRVEKLLEKNFTWKFLDAFQEYYAKNKN